MSIVSWHKLQLCVHTAVYLLVDIRVRAKQAKHGCMHFHGLSLYALLRIKACCEINYATSFM